MNPRLSLLFASALVLAGAAGARAQRWRDETLIVRGWVKTVRFESGYEMSPDQVSLVDGSAILNRGCYSGPDDDKARLTQPTVQIYPDGTEVRVTP